MRKMLISSIAALSLMTFASEAAGTKNNPLISGGTGLYGTLDFSSLKPSDYEEGVKEGIRLRNAEIASIVNQRSIPTFENTIAALDRSGEVLSRSILALSNLENASGDTAMMNVLSRITPILSQHETDIILNEALWDRIRQVYDLRDQDTSLNPEQKRLIEETYETFLVSGAGLEGKAREKYRDLTSELSDLNVRFSQNVSNAMKDPSLRLWLEESDLEGIPSDIKNSYREAAKEAFEADGKPDDTTKYLVTVFAPSYSPFMKYSTRRDLREKLYKLYSGRNIGGEYDNVQILKDIANIRLEIAKLMGKKSYAEYSLQTTMAKTPEAVMQFLENLRVNYTEPMKKELSEIEEFARKTEGDDFKLQAWDYSFWSDKLKNDRYAFNDED
ncbi:MAG: peptidase M3, partial [Muribaculaceae bacterium]|nr:peptidase M3 [Muribaculaceae bacterium]